MSSIVKSLNMQKMTIETVLETKEKQIDNFSNTFGRPP